MARKQIEATFILIDLSTQCKELMFNYFNKFVARVALVNKTQDLFKLAFIGCSDTDNELNYKNIKILHDWQYYTKDNLISYLTKVLKNYQECQTKPGNLFEGVYLACHHLENDETVLKSQPKRIILLTDLCTEQPGDLNKTTSEAQKFLSSSDVWLYVLGPLVRTPFLASLDDINRWIRTVEPTDKLNDQLASNLRLMRGVIKHGLIADWYVGWNLLWVHRPQLKAPFPWYSELTIGDVRIPVNVVKYISDEHAIRWSGRSGGYKEREENSSTEKLVKNPDTGDIVQDAVQGYKVKGRCIVIPADREKDDADRMSTNEERCLEIKYFFDSRAASPLYWKDQSVCCVMPDGRGAGDNCWTPLEALARAMDDQGVAALVKRVYNRGPQFRPKAHVLVVCPDHGAPCLLLAQWPHQQDILVRLRLEREKEVIKQEPQTENDTIRAVHAAYLSSITVSSDDICDRGSVVNYLAPHLAQNPNTESQLQHWVRAHLEPNYKKDKRYVSEFHMHKILAERCHKPAAQLRSLINQD